jgi:hypothetical protein
VNARDSTTQSDGVGRRRDQHDDAPRPTGHFELVFATVVGLTLIALLLSVLLALAGGDSEQAARAAEACTTTYKMGFGAIVGLICGRSE